VAALVLINHGRGHEYVRYVLESSTMGGAEEGERGISVAYAARFD
jgi:hypothetical protein